MDDSKLNRLREELKAAKKKGFWEAKVKDLSADITRLRRSVYTGSSRQPT